MSVKKNFAFNSILLVSQYIIPLIVFPYISRVFGVEKIGLVNFADSIINYFILFSTLGLSIVGVRETAKNKNNPENLNKVFTEILSIHLILTTVILIAYVATILYFDKFKDNQVLFLIGASKLLFNVFLIEWFFSGIENFKFITIRSIAIKVIYVVLLFFFVTKQDDYLIYFGLTCLITIVNAVVNFYYARKYISLSFKGIELRTHIKSISTIGLYLILSSMYTTFNVAYLGIVSTNQSVGYYTTSLKLYTIILGFFSALNTVLIPRLSSLVAEKKDEAFNDLIQKSILFVSTFCFPVIMFGIVLAPQIIMILTGPGYEGAIICFRIIMPLIFIVGIAQILSNQILMSIKKDKELAITSFVGASLGITLNIWLVPLYKEVGTSVVVLASELSVTCLLYYFCMTRAKVRLPFNGILRNFLFSLPYLAICYSATMLLHNNLIILLVAGTISMLYFIISQLFFIKNEILLLQVRRFIPGI